MDAATRLGCGGAGGDDGVRPAPRRIGRGVAAILRADGQAATHGTGDIGERGCGSDRLAQWELPGPRLDPGTYCGWMCGHDLAADGPDHRRTGTEMTAALVAGLLKLLCGAQARWLGVGPSTDVRIYFANHTSNLDAVILWATLPPELRERTRPVAAKDYWTQGRVRPFLAQRAFHALLIERRKV